MATSSLPLYLVYEPLRPRRELQRDAVDQLAQSAGLDNNQSALLQVAREAEERQAEKVEEIRRQREAREEAARRRRDAARQAERDEVVEPAPVKAVDIVAPINAPRNSPVMVQVMLSVDIYNRFRAAAAAEGMAVKDWLVSAAERSLMDGSDRNA